MTPPKQQLNEIGYWKGRALMAEHIAEGQRDTIATLRQEAAELRHTLRRYVAPKRMPKTEAGR
jgi:hypothetical protein